MLRAFHVGKARTSHDGPQSWMRRSRIAAAQLSCVDDARFGNAVPALIVEAAGASTAEPPALPCGVKARARYGGRKGEVEDDSSRKSARSIHLFIHEKRGRAS